METAEFILVKVCLFTLTMVLDYMQIRHDAECEWWDVLNILVSLRG